MHTYKWFFHLTADNAEDQAVPETEAKPQENTNQSVSSPAPKPPPMKRVSRLSPILLIFDYNGVLGRVYDSNTVKIPTAKDLGVVAERMNKSKLAMCRPCIDEFLTWCFKHFHVAFWSTMAEHNVRILLTKVLKRHKDKFKFKWSQKECTDTRIKHESKPIMLKQLQKVYEGWPEYTVDNTLLIDDSRYKGHSNEEDTMICPNSWDPETSVDGNYLMGDLKPWLERLLEAESVRSFVRENRILNVFDTTESEACIQLMARYYRP